MPPLSELSQKPKTATAEEHFAPWFAAIAHKLLNEADFVVAGQRYRFAELEMYYSGWGHSDLFAHRDPVQLEDGRWYFHRTRGEYRGGSFKGWLMRIVTNACYDELRRRKRRPAASLDALAVVETGPDAEGEAQLASEAESPESHAERVELGGAIQRCLDTLPDDQRTAVVLCDIQGMDYGEIAGAMNTALGTVKSRIARARLKLRDCLQHHQELLPASYRLVNERLDERP